MRTTLDIDEDVLRAVKERARLERSSTGRIVSDLLRRALTGGVVRGDVGVAEQSRRFGFRPLPARGSVVTSEVLDQLRDDEGL